MTARYRAAPPDTIAAVRLDTLTAIYHRASGQTHLMASPAPEILAILAEEELGEAELLGRLAAEYDLLDADPAVLSSRLAELLETGLVERR